MRLDNGNGNTRLSPEYGQFWGLPRYPKQKPVSRLKKLANSNSSSKRKSLDNLSRDIVFALECDGETLFDELDESERKNPQVILKQIQAFIDDKILGRYFGEYGYVDPKELASIKAMRRPIDVRLSKYLHEKRYETYQLLACNRSNNPYIKAKRSHATLQNIFDQISIFFNELPKGDRREIFDDSDKRKLRSLERYIQRLFEDEGIKFKRK